MAESTRDYILEAADRLFYEQGYEHTTFAHIADVVQISRGNFYHHFKTKDEILEAVIGKRLADTQAMLDQWEAKASDPAGRIRCFIDMMIVNRGAIKQYGCPVGTLCTELAKLDHAARPQANELFTLFRAWARRQFTLMGNKRDADSLAMHLLARSQGIATLANAFHDESFLRREVAQLHAWLDGCTKATTRRARKD